MQTLRYDALIARAKKSVFGETAGNNTSLKEGDGYDFAQIRPYMYGDNVRRIDWKSSAKTGEIQLRSFFEEKEINVHVVAQMNGSMHFGIKRMKQEVMAEVVAIIGFSAVKNSDNFSLCIFGEKLLWSSTPSKKEAGVRRAVKELLSISPIGRKLNEDSIKHYALNQIKKRSLLFIVGDFFEIPHIEAVAKKHEIVIVKIRDKFEEKPLHVGSVMVVDPQTLKSEKITLNSDFIDSYTKRQKQFEKELGGYFKKNNMRNITVYTDENPYIKLCSMMGRI
ncbi:MAG: DUF58 domain-containing protein [Sulfurospirillaceae bacterium]|nr:DUF58 domain-containing protein [Sulfurospirillaceae bacterium]